MSILRRGVREATGFRRRYETKYDVSSSSSGDTYSGGQLFINGDYISGASPNTRILRHSALWTTRCRKTTNSEDRTKCLLFLKQMTKKKLKYILA